MQTTLLGIAIAVILALLAALIGPHFVDWSRFRPQFEAEATRVIGLPVRVEGAIDARLLPTPSLRLRGVNMGARFDESNARVEQLDVEFSLGSLMRGDWRADTLTLNGLAVDLGLDDSGHMEWASRPGTFNFGVLTVDRLNVTGSLAIKDAASRSLVTFDDVAFNGEVRTGAGAIRGDGAFVAMGTRYPFRLSTGHPADGNGLRLHLTIDPGERAVAADLDGVMTFDDAVPRFDGSLAVNRAIALKATDAKASGGSPQKSLATPWKITAKLKADPSSARFDEVELSYGPDDASMKLGGVAELRLGASPLFHGVLTARQLDADRLLARVSSAPESPLELLKGVGSLVAAAPAPPIAVQLEMSSDLIMLGARPIQNAGADLRSNGRDWLIDHLEFRAPGATAVTLSGRIANLGASADFGGSASIDIGDPDGLMTWLRGDSDAPYVAQKPIQAQGRVSLNKDRIAVDSLKATINGHDVGGSVALVTTSGATRLDASLTADEVDWTSLSAFTPRLAEAPAALPQEMRLALDVGSFSAFGQTLKPVKLQMDYGPKAITIDRLHIGNADGVIVEGNGAFDRASAAGQLNLSTSSSSLDQIGKLIVPIYPKLGQRIAAVPNGAGNVWVGLTLALDKPNGDRAELHANLDLDSPPLKGSIAATVSPTLAAIRALDPVAAKQEAVAVIAKLTADHGSALLTILGLDSALAQNAAPATLDVVASGAWQKPVTVRASLSGRDLDVTLDGSADPWAAEPTASFGLVARKANISPLVGLNPSDPPAVIAATSHVDLAVKAVGFSGLDASVGGSRLRGRLGVRLGDEPTFDGEIGVDVIDVPASIAVATGATRAGQTEPFGRGLLHGWRGRIAFQALRALIPGSEVRPLSGTVTADGSAVTLEGLSGSFADGQGKADVAARRDGDGVAVTGHLQLSGADGAKLRYRGLAMPAGRVSTDITFAATGRSPAAVIGAMSGSGAVTLENGRIGGFDARVFQAAADASDAGQAKDDTRLKALVDPLLANGAIAVGTVEFPLTLKDGQLRVASTVLNGDGAHVVLSGGYDFSAGQVDMRAALSPVSAPSFGGSHPEIQLLVYGSRDQLTRTLDVSALSSWLTLRAVDRETKRLEAIEANTQANQAPVPPATPQVRSVIPAAPTPQAQAPRPQATSPAATSSSNAAVPPLPPPVEVRPSASPPTRPAPQKQRQPLVLTPNGTP